MKLQHRLHPRGGFAVFRNLPRVELREMAAKAFGYQMLDAVTGGADPFPAASDLAAAVLSFVERTEVFFEAFQAVATHGGGAIHVSQSAGVVWFGPAEHHAAFDVFRPNRQP
jgi:hypothetical protein